MYMYIKGGTNIAKHLKLHQQKRTKIQRFTCGVTMFLSMLIGYRTPPKLDYCFIMSTSLVSIAISTFYRPHIWIAIVLHVQTLMWA